MAKVDDASLVDRFARGVAAALVAEIGRDASLARLADAMAKDSDGLRAVRADVIEALRRIREERGDIAAE